MTATLQPFDLRFLPLALGKDALNRARVQLDRCIRLLFALDVNSYDVRVNGIDLDNYRCRAFQNTTTNWRDVAAVIENRLKAAGFDWTCLNTDCPTVQIRTIIAETEISFRDGAGSGSFEAPRDYCEPVRLHVSDWCVTPLAVALGATRYLVHGTAVYLFTEDSRSARKLHLLQHVPDLLRSPVDQSAALTREYGGEWAKVDVHDDPTACGLVFKYYGASDGGAWGGMDLVARWSFDENLVIETTTERGDRTVKNLRVSLAEMMGPWGAILSRANATAGQTAGQETTHE